MALFNYATKEITLKVVYYGPGLSGKTTNLQHLYAVLDPSSKGKFISLATEADRTLFFDFLPVDLGKIKDFSLRFQLYTVPGQIRYNATRKLVLRGADAIIFVADSQRDMREQNIESFKNMRENLIANNINPDDIPVVLQYNKRDLSNILSIEELNHDLNVNGYQCTEAAAFNGTGVKETFTLITKEVLKDIAKKHKIDITPPKKEGISVKLQEKDAFDIREMLSPQHPAMEELEMPVEPEMPLLEPESPEPSITEPPQRQVEIVQAQPIQLPPRVSDEKLDSIISSLNLISQTLTEIRDAVTNNTAETIKASSQEIRQEIKDSQKQQADILKTLSAIKGIFEDLKTKKSWFGF